MAYFNALRKELIFPEGSCPFQNCHASNVCRMDNGQLIACWFAGEKEGCDDVAIWCSRRGEKGWEQPVCAAKDLDEPHWNPVFYQRPDGALLLFYKVGKKIPQWRTMVRKSFDHGVTFTEPEELVKGDRGGRGPVRSKMIDLSDGSVLAGCSTEDGMWTAYADRSADGGKTWDLSGPITIDVDASAPRRGVIQPTLWESEPGRVHMLLRSSEGRVYRADSADCGRTFCKAYPTELPNNNSGIDIARCSDGLLVLCLNLVGENWGPRTPLVLLTSKDNGITWQEEIVLEDAPGEYSYPSVLACGEKLYVTYTHNRVSIAFWEMERKQP